MEIQTQVKYLLDKLATKDVYVCKNGQAYKKNEKIYASNGKELTDEDVAWDYNNIKLACDEIKFIFSKRRTINKTRTSYGLKHVLEKYRQVFRKSADNYISNGEFIISAILADFEPSWNKSSDNPNICFNIHMKEL